MVAPAAAAPTPPAATVPGARTALAQAPAYALNLTHAPGATITAAFAVAPARGHLIALAYIGPENDGPQNVTDPGGTIAGWTKISDVQYGGQIEVAVWVKCAAAGEARTASVTNDSAGSIQSEAILLDIANAAGCPGSTAAPAVPRPAPIVASGSTAYDNRAKLSSSAPLPAVAAGSFVLAGFNFGLSQVYYPQGVVDAPYVWANGTAAGGLRIAGENVQSIISTSGVTTASVFGWSYAIYPTPVKSGSVVRFFTSELDGFPDQRSPVLALIVAPGSASAPLAPLPRPSVTQAVAANAFLDAWGVNTHLSYQDSGGGAYFNYIDRPAPNGNALVTGATGSGRNVLADGVFHHLRDGINHAEPRTADGTSLCALYAAALRADGLDVEAGVTPSDGTDFGGSAAAEWRFRYDCFTGNGAHPAQAFGFEGGPNENNTPGDGTYQTSGNTGLTSAPHPAATVTPIVVTGPPPYGSPQPEAARCSSDSPCTDSNWAQYMAAAQRALFLSRSTSAAPTADPFPSTVRIIAGPVIGAPDDRDFEILGRTLECPTHPDRAKPCSGGAALGSYTEFGNVHGYGFWGGSGNPDAAGPNGRSGLRATLSATQLVTGKPTARATPQPVIITETGISNSPLYAAPPCGQTGYVDLATQAKYTIRDFLQLQLDRSAGAYATYIYDLAKENACDYFGLLDDFLNPTPAYTALRNYAAILGDARDGFPSGAGRTWRPGRLAYAVDGQSDVRSLLLAKRDGSFWLVVWKADAGYDLASGNDAPIPVPTSTPAIRFATAQRSYTAWSIDPATGRARATALPGAGTSRTSVAIWDMPTVVQIGSTLHPPVTVTPQPVACPARFGPPRVQPTFAPLCTSTPPPGWDAAAR
jgi:hypothetical protein